MIRKYIIKLQLFIILLSIVACSAVPEGVSMWIESPESVKVGEEFEILAHINNESDSTVTLQSFDIGDSYLSGVSILKSDPQFSDVSHIPIDNTMEHLFNTEIPSGTHLVVTLNAKAMSVGQHQGDFDFCVNSGVNCDFQSISIAVIAAQ